MGLFYHYFVLYDISLFKKLSSYSSKKNYYLLFKSFISVRMRKREFASVNKLSLT